jgi:predicted nucleic acid-binding protein
MIVVDNSILVPAVVASESSALARRVAARDLAWIVPPLWEYEFTNSMTTLVRTRRLPLAAADEAIVDVRLLVADREIAVDQSEALRFAETHRISGYDAQYVALAATYGVVCVTDDVQLARRAPTFAVLLDDFLA